MFAERSCPRKIASYFRPLLMGFAIGTIFTMMTYTNIMPRHWYQRAPVGISNHLDRDAGDSHTMVDQLRKEIKRLASNTEQWRISDEKVTEDLINRLDRIRSPLPQTSEQKRKLVNPGEDSAFHEDETSVADHLFKKVRILCWIMTHPPNLETRARYIKDTWGRKCNKLLFYSSVANETFPTIALNVTREGRDQLTRKTMLAFKHVHDHYLNGYDWFMRVDDDGYVIMENLRYFLSGQDPNGTLYFGHHFTTIVPGGYFSGGPGIVMGFEALRRFGANWNKNSRCLEKSGAADDADIGFCMHSLGIFVGNTSDRLGRSRFHCFNPTYHMRGGYPDWYIVYDANGAKSGIPTMSDYPIGFHYMSIDAIYMIEYFLYHARPYGIKFGNQNLNMPINKSKAFLPPKLPIK